MKKRFELASLVWDGGGYRAALYNRLGGYYTEHFFIFYSRKDCIRILRQQLDCVVPKRFEKKI